MSELGDVLELLHTAGSRVRTLTGTLLDWYDAERGMRALEAFQVRSLTGGGRYASYGAVDKPIPQPYERRTEVHYAAPDRYRLLRQANPDAHQPHEILHVCDGRREWTYLAAEGEAWVQAPTEPELFHLLDPSWLPAACLLSVTGRQTYEGRPAIGLLGRPRSNREVEVHPVGPGADEMVAVMDAETGLLLSMSSRFEGQAYHVVRLVDVSIDQPLDEDLFRFIPPPGIRVRDLLADRAGAVPLTARLRFRLYGLRHRLSRSRPRG